MKFIAGDRSEGQAASSPSVRAGNRLIFIAWGPKGRHNSLSHLRRSGTDRYTFPALNGRGY